MKKILVIGSSNTDLIYRVKEFPVAGETIEGLSFLQVMGGKGANQAMAAHRLGGDVAFITSLGNDSNGHHTMEYFRQEGLDVSHAQVVKDIPSGTAMILVDDQGENCIVINAGANGELTPQYVRQVEDQINASDMIVMQMEVPYESVQLVSALCRQYGKRFILNVAPAKMLDPEIVRSTNVLIVNQTEAETISQKSIEVIGQEAMLDELLAMGAEAIVLTLGSKGCLFKNKDQQLFIPAFTVKALDTTAAGDTFCGALAASLGRDMDWEKALTFASAAAALSVTVMGAQPSIPSYEQVIQFLDQNKN